MSVNLESLNMSIGRVSICQCGEPLYVYLESLAMSTWRVSLCQLGESRYVNLESLSPHSGGAGKPLSAVSELQFPLRDPGACFLWSWGLLPMVLIDAAFVHLRAMFGQGGSCSD